MQCDSTLIGRLKRYCRPKPHPGTRIANIAVEPDRETSRDLSSPRPLCQEKQCCLIAHFARAYRSFERSFGTLIPGLVRFPPIQEDFV